MDEQLHDFIIKDDIFWWPLSMWVCICMSGTSNFYNGEPPVNILCVCVRKRERLDWCQWVWMSISLRSESRAMTLLQVHVCVHVCALAWLITMIPRAAPSLSVSPSCSANQSLYKQVSSHAYRLLPTLQTSQWTGALRNCQLVLALTSCPLLSSGKVCCS